MFAYCENNPVSAADNNGHECVSIAINGGGGGITPPPPDYRTYEDVEVSERTNCYTYAFDLPYNSNPGTYALSAPNNSFVNFVFHKTYSSRSLTASALGVTYLVCADMRYLNRKCRIIMSPTDATTGESVIAMKVAPYDAQRGHIDYHFAVLLSDGTWADKPGYKPVRRGVLNGYNATWPSNGNYDYSSPTVYFAVGG